MSFAATGPDSYEPQPLHITLRDHQAVDEVIDTPASASLTPKEAKRAETTARLRAAKTERLLNSHNTLTVYGPQGKATSPERNWNSLRPNGNFTQAYASGTFGKPRNRPREACDLDAYEDAKAICEAWRWRLMVAPCCVVAPSPNLRPTDVPTIPPAAYGKMDSARLNQIYAAYALNPEAEISNLQTALYRFAPKAGRLNDCRNLLGTAETDIEAEDILQEFAIDLLNRFQKGQYKEHTGRFHHWIAYVWANGFFPDFKKSFYKHVNQTIAVNEYDPPEDAEGERESGVVYRVDVDREQSGRESLGPNHPERRLERKLAAVYKIWDQLSKPSQIMLRSMCEGATLKMAAQKAGKSERHGRRLLNDALALAGVSR